MKKVRNWGYLAVLAGFLVLWASCTDPTEPPGPGTGTGWEPEYKCSGAGLDGKLNQTKDDLGLDSAIIVKFNGGSATVEVRPASSYVTHEVSGGHVVLNIAAPSAPYNIVANGTTTNGSLKIYAAHQVSLYLNGVSITNPRGPAINSQGKKVNVFLTSCAKENFLQDGEGYATHADNEGEEQAKGAFFSEGSLVFQGGGGLKIRSKNNHAIVADASIELLSGDIVVYESKNDGMHANDDIKISGGTLQIKSTGDGIQNERILPVTFSGGKVTIETSGSKSHGIISEVGVLFESRADVTITLTGDGSKGIRSRGYVRVKGGALSIDAQGGRDALDMADLSDTSSAAGIKADGSVEIEGGTVTIKCTKASQNGKGMNVDGDVIFRGGATRINADGDGIKVRGWFIYEGGTLYARSARTQDIDCKDRCSPPNGGDNIDAKYNGLKEGGGF